MMGNLDKLASSNGVPLSDIGRFPYRAPPQADINGPIDPEMVKAYLARTGMIYPPLFEVNPEAWAAALANMPESANVDDRRGMSRKPYAPHR